jgi:hypothetical protein
MQFVWRNLSYTFLQCKYPALSELKTGTPGGINFLSGVLTLLELSRFVTIGFPTLSGLASVQFLVHIQVVPVEFAVRPGPQGLLHDIEFPCPLVFSYYSNNFHLRQVAAPE